MKILYFLLIPLFLITIILYTYLYRGMFFTSLNTSALQTQKFVQQNITLPSKTAKPTPKPTPIPLKPDYGTKGTYQIGQGAHSGPTIKQVVFDPLDVKKGNTLNIVIKVESTEPLIDITGILTEDNGSQQIKFGLTKGTKLQGEWSGNINLEDSVSYKYILALKATDGTVSTIVVAPRS